MSKIRFLAMPVFAAIIIGSIVSVLSLIWYDYFKEIEVLLEANQPVVREMRIVDSEKRNGNLYIRVFGKKTRQCGAPLFITGTYGAGPRPYKFKEINFLDDSEGDKIKLPDAQPVGSEVNFGWWELLPYPDDEPLIINVFHNCDGMIVRSLIGVFTMEDYVKENEDEGTN